jgi:hypothetical protein
MSLKLDRALAGTGTRFRLFPQPRFLRAFSQPETVRISIPAGSVAAGPADDRMVVIDAINKIHYDNFSGPPYSGDSNPAVQPLNGHFDHLHPDTREFSCATMYATVRRSLDIWEDYFGHSIPWHFETDFERLELIPLIDWDNAQSGYGFLEFGFGRTLEGALDRTRPYCQNFDVLAHELGHSIIFSQVGVPASPSDQGIDYGGMHESAGDLVAIVASLHFSSVVDHLLQSTRGNLFSANELARVGELSESREIRTAFNSLRMSDVGIAPHERSQPLTGGMFDVMVEIFQKRLVAKGLITPGLATRSTQGPGGSPDIDAIQAEFDAAFTGHEDDFTQELLMSRDELGTLLARTWQGLNPNFLTYHDVVRRLLQADRQSSGGRHQQTIRECFAWRGITVPAGSFLVRRHSLVDCGLSADYDRHAELIAAAEPKRHYARNVEATAATAAVAAPVPAPRAVNRKSIVD